LKEHLPIEKVGYHPAVLVLVGIVGGNAADAEDLGVEREIGRTVLSTASAVASRCRGAAREPCLKAYEHFEATYQDEMCLGHGGLEHSDGNILGIATRRRERDWHGR
jgi:hypothetical protein